MTKITIVRANVPDGQKWWIRNWDDYASYLRERNQPVPIRYGIFITHENHIDFSGVQGDFETHVPLIYGIDADSADFEIVDA